jgi:preprotein translocase subunit SecB
MSDETDEDTGGQAEGATQDTQAGQVRLERLYAKDISFESPMTPAVFGQNWEPNVNLELNTRSQKVGDDHYEIVLTVTVTASLEEKTAFIVEVQQAGVFLMTGLSDLVLRRAIGTVCPNTLFPYLREAVDSLIVRGGFPALHLAPVNFDAAYTEALKQQKAQTH